MGYVGADPQDLKLLARRCGEAADDLEHRWRRVGAELAALGAAGTCSGVTDDLARIEAWLRDQQRALSRRAAEAEVAAQDGHHGWGILGHAATAFGHGVWEGTTGVVKGVFGLAEMAEHQAEEPARLAEALRERGLDGLISEVRSELDREERLVRGLITEARRLGDLTNRLGPTAPFYFAADARRHGIDHALSHLAHDAGTLVPQAVLMVATDGLGEATTAEAESAAAVDDVATATHAPMPTTFADLPEPAGWGRLETLADHLRDHMRDLGARDAEEYVGQADQLLDEAREGKHLVRVDPDKNIIRVYDPETRRFGSYNVDGTAKTFFRPKRLDYFDGRQGRLIRG